MSYAVFTDTSSNLPTALLDEKNVHVVPFSYYIDGEEQSCTDTAKFNGDEYYEKLRHGLHVTTSQVPPQRYMEHFEPVLAAGQDILMVSMSSGISGSCDSARIAAEALKESYPLRKIEIIDTLSASLGEGIVVLRAIELCSEGVQLEAAAGELRVLSRRICQIFTVDDLMHLRRGGRLSNISAVVGTVLQIKPLLLGNEEGKIVAIAKVRGRKRSIEALAAKFDELAVAPETQTACIAQAGCPDDAEYLASLLRKNHPPKDILTVEYEPMTGAHVGPGALALFFIADDNVRSIK